MERSVLITDDETMIRKGLRALIERAGAGFTRVEERGDGQAALDLLRRERFDLVILDIRMPRLDGLALMKKLAEEMIRAKVVILSGHDDFAYAQEAIRYGVTEYLLKPVDRNAFTEALHKVKRQLDAEESEKENLRAALSGAFNYALTDGGAPPEELRAALAAAGESFFERPFYVGVFNAYPDENRLAAALEPGLFSGWDESERFCFTDREGRCVCMSPQKPDYDALALRLSETVNGAVFCGYSEERAELPYVHRVYKNALAALDERFARPDERVFCFRESCEPARLPLSDETLGKMSEMIGSEAFPEARRGLLSLFEREAVEKGGGGYFTAAAEAAESMVLRPAARYAGDIGFDLAEALSPKRFAGPEGYLRELARAVDILHEKIKSRAGEARRKTSMDLALEFIEKNYHRQDLSMTIAANEASMNYSYFSIAFKQRTGVSFVSYLKRLRVEKSKALLRKGVKVCDAARAVGYNNPALFSSNFREEVGISPLEYSKKNYGGKR